MHFEDWSPEKCLNLLCGRLADQKPRAFEPLSDQSQDILKAGFRELSRKDASGELARLVGWLVGWIDGLSSVFHFLFAFFRFGFSFFFSFFSFFFFLLFFFLSVKRSMLCFVSQVQRIGNRHQTTFCCQQKQTWVGERPRRQRDVQQDVEAP